MPKKPLYKKVIGAMAAPFLRLMPDWLFLQIKYFWVFKKPLNLLNPKSFNEKIQWLKLYDRKPHYTQLVDKYEVRKYVADKIGEEYLVPLLGVWNHAEEIDFEKLPNQFVLKCTHDSGSVVVCKDKDSLDKNQAIHKLKKALRTNYYWEVREWPYKDMKPRVIAEEYLEDETGELKDYKVYCFGGTPKLIVVFHDRFNPNEPKSQTVYDTEWNVLPCILDTHFEKRDFHLPKPQCLEELLKISKILCQGFSQVRVDFYIIRNRILFGEITLHTAGGLTHLVPDSWDTKLGEWTVLPTEEIK